VDRHYDFAAGERTTRHWHVDYLLGSDAVAVRGDVRTPGADVECTVASALGDGIVDGFGASDCACTAHLAHDGDGGRLRRSVSDAHGRFSTDG
jgi:endonuclease-3